MDSKKNEVASKDVVISILLDEQDKMDQMQQNSKAQILKEQKKKHIFKFKAQFLEDQKKQELKLKKKDLEKKVREELLEEQKKSKKIYFNPLKREFLEMVGDEHLKIIQEKDEKIIQGNNKILKLNETIAQLENELRGKSKKRSQGTTTDLDTLKLKEKISLLEQQLQGSKEKTDSFRGQLQEAVELKYSVQDKVTEKDFDIKSLTSQMDEMKYQLKHSQDDKFVLRSSNISGSTDEKASASCGKYVITELKIQLKEVQCNLRQAEKYVVKSMKAEMNNHAFETKGKDFISELESQIKEMKKDKRQMKKDNYRSLKAEKLHLTEIEGKDSTISGLESQIKKLKSILWETEKDAVKTIKIEMKNHAEAEQKHSNKILGKNSLISELQSQLDEMKNHLCCHKECTKLTFTKKGTEMRQTIQTGNEKLAEKDSEMGKLSKKLGNSESQVNFEETVDRNEVKFIDNLQRHKYSQTDDLLIQNEIESLKMKLVSKSSELVKLRHAFMEERALTRELKLRKKTTIKRIDDRVGWISAVTDDKSIQTEQNSNKGIIGSLSRITFSFSYSYI